MSEDVSVRTRRYGGNRSYTPEELERLLRLPRARHSVAVEFLAGPALWLADAAVSSGRVVFTGDDYDVAVSIGIEEDPRPHVVVDRVEVIRRPGQPGLSARRISGLGELMSRAVAHLTLADDPERHVHSAMTRSTERPSRVDPAEVEAAARLYDEAVAKGIPTGEWVRQGLSREFGETSLALAKKRIRQAGKRRRKVTGR